MSTFSFRTLAAALGVVASAYAFTPAAEAGTLSYAFSYTSSGFVEQASGYFNVDSTPLTLAAYEAYYGDSSQATVNIYNTLSATYDIYLVTNVSGTRTTLTGRGGNKTETTQAITGIVTAAQDAVNSYKLGVDDLIFAVKGTSRAIVDDSGVGFSVLDTLIAVYNDGTKTEYSVPLDSGNEAYTTLTSLSITQVPEPMTLSLLGAGLVGLGLARRRSTRI